MAKNIDAGKATVEVGIRSRIRKGLAGIKAQLRGFAFGVAKIAAVGGAGMIALGGGILAAASKFAKFGDMLHKVSARTGVGVEALSQYKFAAEQAGTDLETVEKAFFGLSRSMFDAKRGSGEAVDALAEIGLQFSDLADLAPDQQFDLIAKKLAQIEDMSLRGAVAQRIFGRAGRQILPMVENLDEARKRAEELGITFTQKDAAAAAELTDRFNELKSVVSATVVRIGAAFAPMLSALTKNMAEAMANIQQFFDDHFGGIIDSLKSGDLALAGQIAFTQLKITAATILEQIAGFFGVTTDQIFNAIAILAKNLGNVAARLNELRAEASNWIAQRLGDIVGVEVLREDSQALINARNFRQTIESIDTDKLGAGLAKQFDLATLKDELAALEAQAEQQRIQAESRLKNQQIIPPQLEKAMESAKASFVGSFSGAQLARLATGQRPAEETAKNTKKLTQINQKIVDAISAAGPLVFSK